MIKTLAVHIKGYIRESVLTPLFMILEVVMETIIPWLMSTMIDDGINKGDMNHIIVTGLWMLLCALIALFAGIMGGVYGAKASAGFAKNLRQAMFENIQSFSFANIDKYSTAGLVTRMTTDVTNIQNAYQMLLRICFRAPINLIAAMTMTLIINAKLASVYLIAVAFLGIVMAFIITRTYRYFSKVFERYDDLNASVQENVSSIRVVKAFVREEHEVGKFNKAANNLYRLFVKAENLMVSVSPLMMLTVYGSIIAISWFGANMIVGSELTTGELTTMLTYCMQILMSLMMVAFIFVMLTMSLASAKRISGVLDEKSTLTNPENPDYNVEDGSIDFENVSFSYSEKSERPVLSNIDLHIRSARPSASSAVRAAPRPALSTSSADSTTSARAASRSAARTSAPMISRPCATVFPSSCRRTCCSAARYSTTSAGATKRPPRRNASKPAGSPARTNSYAIFPRATTPRSSRAVRMFRADRSSASVSREPC